MSRILSLAREVEIVNRAGLHARPAAQFVRLAETFTCTIRIEKDAVSYTHLTLPTILRV